MNKKAVYFFLFLIVSLVPLRDLFLPGLPITHDGQDHVARIANFYQNLKEGVIIPRWAANLNWGYGHPILMFLYPLPSYVASLFHFLGFSLVVSVKIVFGFGFICSGIAMYMWVKNLVGEKGAIIASFLYMFAPYRFVDLYVRGAIGEHIAFVFPPLVLYFLNKLTYRNNKWCILGGGFSLAALILSHNAITLMFIPIFLFYVMYIYYFSSLKRKLFLSSVLIFLLGFMLSAFFWMPAFFEGKYTLRDIVTAKSFASSFSTIGQLIYGKWNYGGTGAFTVQVGLLHWIAIIFAIPTVLQLQKKNKELKVLLSGLMVVFLLSLFFMMENSLFIWNSLTIVQKFQFPWRFLTISVFLSSVIGGIISSQFFIKSNKVFFWITAFLIVFATKDYWHANGFLLKDHQFYTSVYNGTTDTGESAPRWSVRFMEKRPKDVIEIIEGSGKIKKLERMSTFHSYEINATSKIRIRENTLYFPGWNVYDGASVLPIEFQDPANRGLITYFLSPGQHEITVKFEETKLRKAANSISAFTSVLLTGVLW